MPAFSEVSRSRLATAHPLLQEIFNEVITIVDCVILEGHRGQAAQEQAFLAGTTKLHWPLGKHNRFPSLAVDAAPYLPGIKIDWNDLPAFGRLMGVVQAIGYQRGVKLRFGLDWDMDFRTAGRDPDEHFLDAPHVELVL